MIETYTSVHIHLVWSTWDRQPLITADIESDIHNLIGSECQHLRAFVNAIGGTEDHVHVLVGIPPTITIAELAKQVKGASSYVVNERRLSPVHFRWQGSYGAFGVSEDRVPVIKNYIVRQREHHAAGTTIASLEWNPSPPVMPSSDPSSLRSVFPAKAGR